MNQIPQHQKHSASSNPIYKVEQFFGIIGAVIRSLAFALGGMLFFMAYRFFEVQNLFFEYFPENLTGINRNAASYLIAIVFIIPTVLFMSNADKLKNLFTIRGRKGITPALAMSLITLVINLFFWKVWIGTLDQIIFKGVISIITAYLDYTFSELFNKKFQDWQRTSTIHQSFYALETKLNELKTAVNDQLRKLNESKQKVSDQKALLTEINEEIRYKKKALERLACPYCLDYIGEHQNGLNKHLGTCKKRHHEKAA